jgi:S-adenosyl-L-methionine hydrolase (adenosine-forming)
VAGRAGSVFLLTDYGLADEFAGVVRASVSRHAPGVPIIDLTHGVTPFDVRAGALGLVRAVPYLGPGVVLAVVDPGVGTARRAVAVSVTPDPGSEGPRHFVGPDNGLLPWAVDAVGAVRRAVTLPRPSDDAAGATFDGRDVFAPAAARLWRGEDVAELGDDLDPDCLVRLAPPRTTSSPGTLETEVLWVDRFGNVQLAARPDDATAAALGVDLKVVTAATGVSRRAARVTAFAALGPGALGLIVDANRHLALVCDRRSAATVLEVHPGDLVTLRSVVPGPGSP